ncbi:hypothetical protein SAMN06297251_102106 [Fulvimarina manganoxydans]|uniref:PD-(D/E)XK nuclease superfamily protein n=1 Tax=Fulvimarina manganoxydans TaxID=937218 RepID=A0A1W1YZ76_9HYPH|nr:hypothetical protein [Fulvimarina manganoxydans]SMC41527.1 hypothetical protein SAMN06297251_102106 [Fulvimarina manganoxydans]
MVALAPNLISQTITAIDAALADRQRPRFQRRLSGSMIGKECERAIWFQFRWAYEPERFSGQMLRLFETGHLREPRVFRELALIGVKASDIDPETGEQWTFTELDGHFVVKIDGRGTGFVEAPKTEHIVGIKTMNDKNFKELKKVGIAVSKPEHVAQAQSEMHCSGIHRFFYYAVNKDTDELYSGADVRIRYDEVAAIKLMVKAKRVLDAIRPPEPISQDRSAFACRFCKAKAVCGGEAFAPRTCRSCLHSTPALGGDAEWRCEKHGTILTVEDQEAGCGEHLFIPELVPGSQIDVAPDGSSVTYEMPDGTTWVDGIAQEAA